MCFPCLGCLHAGFQEPSFPWHRNIDGESRVASPGSAFRSQLTLCPGLGEIDKKLYWRKQWELRKESEKETFILSFLGFSDKFKRINTSFRRKQNPSIWISNLTWITQASFPEIPLKWEKHWQNALCGGREWLTHGSVRTSNGIYLTLCIYFKSANGKSIEFGEKCLGN